MPRYDSFIMRTWSDGGRLLHGYIVHLATKRQVAFTTLQRIPDFVQGQIGTDTCREGEQRREEPGPLDAEDGMGGPAR